LSVQTRLKVIVVCLSKQLYPISLVAVDSRNGFEHDVNIELYYSEGLMVDYYLCQTRNILKKKITRRRRNYLILSSTM